VVERYRDGFDAKVRFVSWSMAKSVTATAIGILVDEGRLRLDDPAPVPAWRAGDDPRGKITIRHLLNMSSGLQHQEGSEGGKPIHTADTVRLLFTDGAQDTAAYAASRPLAHPPGTHWQYSTATTHILAEIVANAITAAKEPSQRRRDTVAWFKGRLWDPLGITTAEWDFDARGLFLGGSLLHMTAADYLRLGRLYLDRGLAPDGRRIVSETWLAAALAKAPAANNNQYAGQFWLNTGPSPTQQPVLFHPAGGADTFAMLGHLGQYVIVVPSKRAVIVRLGKTANADRGPVRTELGRLIDALQAVP
jgi:CubicO group peptidase (beta-lactamase class C family)